MSDSPDSTTSGGSDILYSASIDDNTGAFFDKFDANVDKTAQTANTGFAKVAGSMDPVKANFSLMSAVVVGAGVVIGSVLKGIGDAAVQLLKDSYQVTAAYDKLGATMYIVGQNAGYTSKQMDAFEASMVKSDIGSMGARNSLTKMAQAQLDLSKASDLSTVAADASAVSHTSVSASMDRLVRSVQTLSPLYLRQMGIYVNLQQEYKKYADAHNTEVKYLDQHTKQAIMLNAVLEKGATIQGAYAASMQTAAGQAQRQALLLEELHVAAGRVVQPAYLAFLQTVNGAIEDFTKFLTDNKEPIEKFGNDVGVTFRLAAGFAKDLIKAVADLANTVGIDFDSTISVLETFNKVLALTKALFDGILAIGFGKEIAEGLREMIEIANMAMLAIEGKYAEAIKANDEFLANRAKFAAAGNATKFNDAFNASIAESNALMQDYAAKSNEAETAASKLTVATQAEADAMDQMNVGLEALQKKLEEDAATAALKKTRDAIESALRDAWQQEDMARTLADNLAQIDKNGQDQKMSLVKQYAEARWQAEHNYQVSLQKMKEDFEYSSSELIRRRDAVGILKLSRDYDKQLKDAKASHDDQASLAKRSYDTAVKDLNDSIAKQVKAANDAYAKQETELARSKAREKIIQDLHDKWVLEDIQTSTDKQVKALIDQYSAMEGATAEGLNVMLAQWGDYYTNLGKLIAAGPLANGTTTTGSGSGENVVNPTKTVGQAGLVTSMLTPSFDAMRPAALGSIPVSRLPAVQSGGSSDYRKLDINVAGNGLDPYIQRVLVRTLAEIERNR
jgi:hypothetical protein